MMMNITMMFTMMNIKIDTKVNKGQKGFFCLTLETE